MTDRISKTCGTGSRRSSGSTATGSGRADEGRTIRMLNRQRAILALLDEAGGEASHLPTTKWAFLLREETPSRGGSSFYQFLPYKYGPFSFCLFQEAAALARRGFINESDQEWSLTAAGRRAARQVTTDVRTDIRGVIRAHAKKSNSALIKYVYDRFPWFTVNSEIRQDEHRSDAAAAVYTAGYEGLLVDGFLDGLMRNGIRRLIDVRNNPVSRRYGFHKTTLNRLCRSVGIDYVHFPQLGIDSRDRQDLDRPGAREALFDQYARVTLSRESHAIGTVGRLVGSGPSVLVCMEACHRECHRSRLATAIAQRTGLPIRHLELRS